MKVKITPVPDQLPLVTLTEVKEFLMVDYPDFDSLLTMLLKSAMSASARFTGLVYPLSTVEVTEWDECKDEKYPIQPFIEDLPTIEGGHSYTAGYTTETFPDDLKIAILTRVADGFKYRESSTTDAVNATVTASVYTEFSYRVNPMI